MGRFSPSNGLRKVGEHEADCDDKQALLLSSGSPPPKDWFLLTYVILFIHGIGHLLPWNMFITAHDYFQGRFSCSHDVANTSCDASLENHFESWFSISAMLPVVIMNFANVYIQSRKTAVHIFLEKSGVSTVAVWVHFKWRMLVSLVVMLGLFVLTSGLVFESSMGVNGFFAVTIITITILSLSSGLFQSSTFGFAGILPPKYTSTVMVGQACAGIFSAVVRIITTVASSNSKYSALGYFLSGVFVLAICLVSFFILMNLKFTQYYMEKTTVKAIKVQREASVKAAVSVSVKPKMRLPFLFIFGRVFVCSLSVFLVFAVTISLFPAVIANIKSTTHYPGSSIWTDKLFDALVCFLIFNCADFVGRFLSGYIQLKGRWQYLLLVISLTRLIFIPLVLMCNVRPRAVPVFFNSDVAPVLLTTALGLSNGFTASVAMVSVGYNLETDHRETGSIIAASFLALGLLAGASLSFLFTPMANWL